MGKYTSELLEGERRVPGWNLLPGIYPRETLSYVHGEGGGELKNIITTLFVSVEK